jgi:hypothetical protein
MIVKHYRKKPVVIEAALFTKENQGYIAQWCRSSRNGGVKGRNGQRYIDIDTLEGTMTANIGDYIIKGVKGEFYPCKPDIFKATYEPVDAE